MICNIGMTGGIGCGKNTVADIFKKYGFYVIDSDESSREVMKKGGLAYDKIVECFGSAVLYDDGEINRKVLGSIVFADKEQLKTLESIVHPAIFEYENKLRGSIRGKDDKAVIITHAALMIESGRYETFDALIVITADKEKCIERVMARDNKSQKEVEDIMVNQISDDERLKYANIVIENSGDLERLEAEVKRIVDFISQMNYAIKHS